MKKINYDYVTYLSHAKNFRQRFLILHYTALNFADSVNVLTGSSVSAHYLVPTLRTIDPTYPNKELVVYSLVNEMERAWHAGVSSWKDRTNLNDTSIGIETVNMADGVQFPAYPDDQVKIIIDLCKNILSRFPDITPTNVLGHSDIAVGRKQDPGPAFPWKTLYNSGIGAWFDPQTVNKYIEQFTSNMPSAQQVIAKLSSYGYNTNVDQKSLFTAFQMHFRPDNYKGILDAETAAIAYALCDKYVSS